MIDTKELTSCEKRILLEELLNDPEMALQTEAEFQARIGKMLKSLSDAIEDYLKDVDRIRSEERKNMWTTTQEGWISQGRAEVCARIKTIITEITARPWGTQGMFDLMEDIGKRKNMIVDNELSNYCRGYNNGLWHRLFTFEGKCADVLENEWIYAFYLGLQCRASLSKKQLNEIRDKEYKIYQKLMSGTYDGARFWKGVLDAYLGKTDGKAEMVLNMLPKKDNPNYEQIMDFMSDYVENKDD